MSNSRVSDTSVRSVVSDSSNASVSGVVSNPSVCCVVGVSSGISRSIKIGINARVGGIGSSGRVRTSDALSGASGTGCGGVSGRGLVVVENLLDLVDDGRHDVGLS